MYCKKKKCWIIPLISIMVSLMVTSESDLSTANSEIYDRFELSEDMYARQIQPGAFVITHKFPWAANSMILEMEDSSLVMVDTPYTPDATGKLVDWIISRFGERKIIEINTGFHYDNLGGNGYLIEHGIPVYGSDMTAKLLEERGEQMRIMTLEWLKDPKYKNHFEVHKKLKYSAPTHQFEINKGLELKFGDEIIKVYYPGPSHSPDNIVVYFPGRKILFGGCMIIGWDKVGNTSDADMAQWPESVHRLSQFEFDVLVPGHGDRLDPGLLEHTLNLLANYQKQQ